MVVFYLVLLLLTAKKFVCAQHLVHRFSKPPLRIDMKARVGIVVCIEIHRQMLLVGDKVFNHSLLCLRSYKMIRTCGRQTLAMSIEQKMVGVNLFVILFLNIKQR